MKAITIAFTLLAVMAFAACSQSDNSQTADMANGGASAASSAEEMDNDTTMADAQSDMSNASGPAVLKVAMSDKYGAYLVDENGRALYTIVDDESPDDDVAQGPEGQHIKAEVVPCENACVKLWPVYETNGEVAAKTKVDQSLIHTFTRADGSTQVIYSGYPLYHYVKDQKAGDIMGQGVTSFGGTWYLVGPDGEEIDEPVAETGM